jgi:hypothetical protein
VAAWAQATGQTDDQVAQLVERADRAQAEVVNWRRALPEPGGLADIQREIQAIEQQARTFREFQPLLVPGLIQTAEYARRAFLAEEPDGPDIGGAVQARLERQAALYDASRRFEFLMSEAALRWRMGPTAVQGAQLDRIRQVMTLSNVYVGVVPLDVEAPIWRYHGFAMFDDLIDDGDALVVVETLGRNLSIGDPEGVERYRETFWRLQEFAVTGPEARALIDQVEREGRPESG